jgi:hypothetical protein
MLRANVFIELFATAEYAVIRNYSTSRQRWLKAVETGGSFPAVRALKRD